MSLAVLIIGQLLINRYYLGDEAVDADVNAVGPILWTRHCSMFSGFVLCLSLSHVGIYVYIWWLEQRKLKFGLVFYF